MIDSGTELGLSEVAAVRETVDTGEIGEFMPQLRALSRGQSGERAFPRGPRQRHHQRDDVPVFGGGGGGGGRFGGGERQYHLRARRR